LGAGGEKIGRRGGLGLWYDTKSENGIKGEETDFLATTPLPKPIVPPAEGSLRPSTEKVVLSMPTDSLNDITDEKKAFPIRQSLLRKHGRIKMHTTLRDAHVYFLPYWVLQMMKANETFDSINEDVLGWWAKATWQEGLAEKLGLRDILDPPQPHHHHHNDDTSNFLISEADVISLSTTHCSISQHASSKLTTTLASRVHSSPTSAPLQATPPLQIPPFLATLHTPTTNNSTKLVRRIDTTPSLLATSLSLALLTPPSPLAHLQKIASPDSIPSQARISHSDTIIDANTTIAPKTTIKECVIGTRCAVGSGARLTRCVLFEGAEVSGDAQLTGCVLGRGCRVEGRAGRRTVLWDCEVGHGFVVPEGTEARGEKFVAGHGLEEGLEEEIGEVEDIPVSEG
jgi:translation initiation factor eIF-2B subunit gamma